MIGTESKVIMALFTWVPYVLVSWGYMKLSDGGTKVFWFALLALVAARTFFSIIETISSVLAWRVYGKKQVVERNLTLLRTHSFPKRQYQHDDFLNYLARIESDPTYSSELKTVAKQMETVLIFCESFGILLGMRMHAAADESLNTYSPKAETPQFEAERA